MKTGILGGSFNPPHLGHLLLAESARSALALDAVLFIPAWRSPFKDDPGQPDAMTRCEMVELAISDNHHFRCDSFEARRPGISYTVDTIRHLRAERPDDELVLLLGADAFAEFHMWKQPEAIVRDATIAVAGRGGLGVDIAAMPFADHARFFTMPALEISSSDIRTRVREGRSILYLVPWTVHTFITARGLYR